MGCNFGTSVPFAAFTGTILLSSKEHRDTAQLPTEVTALWGTWEDTNLGGQRPSQRPNARACASGGGPPTSTSLRLVSRSSHLPLSNGRCCRHCGIGPPDRPQCAVTSSTRGDGPGERWGPQLLQSSALEPQAGCWVLSSTHRTPVCFYHL